MFGRSSRKKAIRHDEITAFLGAGTQYNGQFDFQGIVRIDGGVNGDITSDGTLVLGEGGFVEGRIRVGTLISNGRVKGDVEASLRVVLNKNSILEGNVRSPAVVIEEGAIINGQVSMEFTPLTPIPERTGETGD
jgi:cytoskeletal protein CcmA (bactofilin family)